MDWFSERKTHFGKNQSYFYFTRALIISKENIHSQWKHLQNNYWDKGKTGNGKGQKYGKYVEKEQ